MADQVLQDIKDRLDIAEVIGGYIQVKKSGANFKAVCPFHSEKSASLMISVSKQIWHCFGCGEGGDVFGFVMRYENLEFRDTLKLLAQRAGVQLPEYQPQSKEKIDEHEQLLKINDFAARYYHEILLKDKASAPARDYLKKRGLSQATINQWLIGHAPDDFHFLERALTKKNVPLQDLVKAGMSVKGEKGGQYDRFRGRITFPVFNAVGDVVGFSARILSGDDKSAKYINSPETPIYNKSKVLFGFFAAKGSIRKKDEAIIVEGQMDCISAHQAGFTNTVASSGTALTEPQLIQIGRFTKNLKFCFDSDSAGWAATRRAVSQYLGGDYLIKIITLPDAKDPDELIRKDAKGFERAVANAQLFLDFYIEKLFKDFTHTVENKKQVAKELLPLVAKLNDPLERDHYIKILADKLGTIPSVLLESLHKIVKGKLNGPHSVPKTISLKSDGPSALEKQVLGGIMLYPEILSLARQQLSGDDFQTAQARELAQSLLAGQTSKDMQDSFLAKESIFMVESQRAESDGGDDAAVRELKKAFALLKLQAIRQQQKDLNAKIQTAEQQQKKEELLELNTRFAHLSEQRMSFEKML